MSNLYNLYDSVVSAYGGDEGTFNAYARNWITNADKPPFDNADANVLFDQAKRNYNIWQNNAINSRFAKKQMIAFVRKIAEMELPNPYEKEVISEESQPEKDVTAEPKTEELVSKEDPKTEEIVAEERKEEKPLKEKKVQKTEGPEHVLGVVPEEKKGFFKRHKE